MVSLVSYETINYCEVRFHMILVSGACLSLFSYVYNVHLTELQCAYSCEEAFQNFILLLYSTPPKLHKSRLSCHL